MKVKEISRVIEAWAPPPLAESYDNVGLLVGNPEMEVKAALINLDVTESLIDEAIEKGCNMIITHHPIWFMGRKRLNGEDYVSRIIISAIKNDIALYAVHTNLDNVKHGVNHKICDLLGLQNRRILSPKKDTLNKLVVYVPNKDREALADALYAAGAGKIGNYSEAGFYNKGTGSFRPLEGANPTIGKVGEREYVDESRLEVVFPFYLKGTLLNAMRNAHPYETPAYHVIAASNPVEELGSGMIGHLEHEMDKVEFLQFVKDTFDCGGIRYADAPLEKISKVAVCGGAGSFLTRAARSKGAHAFITGDITYHKFFDNENQMLLMDIGHYESEQFTSNLIYDFLSKKFPNFAVQISELKSNPVKYF